MTSPVLPQRFRAAGLTCGIKQSGKPDLALFESATPCTAAGVFTQNRVVGAPVIVSRRRVPSSSIRAVVVNSGNSNACTGEQGIRDAETMTAAVAQHLSCAPEDVLVCSTGVIGVPLPVDVITAGIPNSVKQLASGSDALRQAATAMMTTDTFAKTAGAEVRLRDGCVIVSGAAKGAAMIAPNMATMLCVVMTDARLTEQQCQNILQYAVNRSFNCISVDGHMSTSDTVLLLANGASGQQPNGDDELTAVRDAVAGVCEKLATAIIRDAEGAEHFITIDVEGFETREAAFGVAKEIAESALVKTAITGADPNWGRITSAAGYAGIDFDPSFLSLKINETLVFRSGTPVAFDAAGLSQQMKDCREVHLQLQLSGGPSSGTEAVRFWTSDLTQEYVRLNSEYTT